MHRRISYGMVTVALLGAALSGCGSQESSAPMDLKGVWSGTYRFPSVSNAIEESPLTIEITRQEGPLLWGIERWTNKGEKLQASMVGSFSPDGSQITLAEVGGSFNGFVQDNSMRLQFVRTDDPPTAFYVTVVRQ
ncbi:MAG: hypothetical protein F2923_07035 [Actinobacteria bacterium]|uniref:Unannotated protein n=1 Tax=freshwater metagenome TaxID=449393 RepID=A0A6J7GAR6_9ZZZZ|nr:hypothetical protein [Actinomycetota bacterium]MTB28381.1 hypothetical protein [Actinomycetota bacterium]